MLGKGRGVSWIFCLQRTKCCVETLCKLVPGHGAQGHSDLILSPALGASNCLHPWHMVRPSQVSWRVWSHDLNLSNLCVPSSLATVIGSGLGQWPIGIQGQNSGSNQGEEELWFCWKERGWWGQSTQWEKHEFSLGRLVTFLLPSGQSDFLKAYIVLPDSLKWCRSFPMPLEGRSRSSSLLKCPSVQISLLVSSPGLCSRRLAHQFPPCSSTYWAFAPALLSALKAIPCSVASPLSLFNTYFKFHSRFTSLEKCMIFQIYTCILWLISWVQSSKIDKY